MYNRIFGWATMIRGRQWICVIRMVVLFWLNCWSFGWKTFYFILLCFKKVRWSSKNILTATFCYIINVRGSPHKDSVADQRFYHCSLDVHVTIESLIRKSALSDEGCSDMKKVGLTITHMQDSCQLLNICIT